MTNDPNNHVVGSSSTPEGWTPPKKHEKPAYQPPTTNNATNTGNTGSTSKQHPVIDETSETVTQSQSESSEDYSPTELAKLAGVKPQMMYNYIAQGLIEHFINPQGRKRIKKDVALAWLKKYLTNKQEREQQRKQAIRRQLNGEV